MPDLGLVNRLGRIGLTFQNVAHRRLDWSELTTAASPVTAFKVTGDVLVYNVVGVTVVAMASTSNTGTISVGTTGDVDEWLATTTMDGTNFAAVGDVWVDNSPTTDCEAVPNSNIPRIVGGVQTNIIVTTATNNATAGKLDLYCIWQPLGKNGSVTGSASAVV